MRLLHATPLRAPLGDRTFPPCRWSVVLVKQEQNFSATIVDDRISKGTKRCHGRAQVRQQGKADAPRGSPGSQAVITQPRRFGVCG